MIKKIHKKINEILTKLKIIVLNVTLKFVFIYVFIILISLRYTILNSILIKHNILFSERITSKYYFI